MLECNAQAAVAVLREVLRKDGETPPIEAHPRPPKGEPIADFVEDWEVEINLDAGETIRRIRAYWDANYGPPTCWPEQALTILVEEKLGRRIEPICMETFLAFSPT